MRRHAWRSLTAALLLSIPFALGAQEGAEPAAVPTEEAPPQLDREKLHELVLGLVEESSEMTVDTVECDEDLPQVVGRELGCRVVTGTGASLPVRIEVIGPQGHVNALLDDPRIDEALGPSLRALARAVEAADTDTVLSLGSEAFRNAVEDPESWAVELGCRGDSLGPRTGADQELYGWLHPEAGRGFAFLRLEHERGRGEVGVTFGLEDDEWKVVGLQLGTRMLLDSLPEIRALDEPAREALDRLVASDWEGMYGGIADAWRARTSPEQLREQLDDRRASWGELHEIVLDGIGLSSDRAYPELEYSVVFSGGAGTYRATLMRCDGSWEPVRMNVEIP